MDILRYTLIILSLILLMQQALVYSLPVAGDSRSKSDRSRESSAGKSNQKDDICGNKGRFCELICKNNPSEGGKMCNCDAYALRCDPAVGNCNRYIRMDIGRSKDVIAFVADR